MASGESGTALSDRAKTPPPGETPRETEKYEGFFHLCSSEGSVERAHLHYIVRDHGEGAFEARKETLRRIEKTINGRYGAGTAKLTVREQYRNMAEVLTERMDIIERAKRAMEKRGIAPIIRPVRGGTDGAQLSFRGLPCPNLGTGGSAFHGPYEHITAEHMDEAVDIILNIIEG